MMKHKTRISYCRRAAWKTTIGRRKLDYTGPNQELLVQHIADFEKLDDYKDLFSGHDHVYCALGTTRKGAGNADRFIHIDQGYVIHAAELCHAAEKPATHFIYVSSVGADKNSLFLYPKTKGETEAKLEAIGFPKLTILRPGMLKNRTGSPRLLESVVGTVLPVIEFFVGEKRVGADCVVVARAMRELAVQGEQVGSQGVKAVQIIDNATILQLAKDKVSKNDVA